MKVWVAPSHLRAAVFDLDGTLLDTLGDFDVAINAMLRELALPSLAREHVAAYIGRGSDIFVRRVLAHVGAPPERLEEALSAYFRHYEAVNGDNADPFEGIVEGLERLGAAGWRLGCLTNKPLRYAAPLLERRGLAQHFSVIFGGDSFTHKKPHPQPLLGTCTALGTTPAQTLMVGDSVNDAQAARAAGCPVVLLRHGYNHGEPIEAVDADAHLDTLAQLRLS